MARLQIISTYDQSDYAACEALWIDFADAATQEGHSVEALVSEKVALHPKVLRLAATGARILTYRPASQGAGALSLVNKVWRRTGESWLMRRKISAHPDLRIFNVGTMVELGIDPWANLSETALAPTAAIVHSNSEVRLYPPQVNRRLSQFVGNARRVYFVSDRLYENAEELLTTHIPGAATVRNPVNLDSLQIEPWPEADVIRFAIVGRLDAFVKGHVRLLHALSSDRWRSRRWELGIFGDGPDREIISNAANFYGLSDRVHFCGFVTDVRSSVWKRHHVLVMPSLLEGMPLALVEAMVCGRPAVCSDVGGASELIRDGINGFLAQSPFAKQLAEGMERMWQCRGTLQSLGKAAHADALSFIPDHPGKTLLRDVLNAIEK